ncbi:hypothetical protein Poly30_37320 [Planctomycetes bacterium Poly30]|uniref:Right handed beta helix domain-containing protein n=1 Tax=Saltatorellus ferox TaxID=2528018 RepID=A0A518EVS7_9BACT|nr:hypothetical protein Poly30_37320 [Planctomycetes bacterium Poly30]
MPSSRTFFGPALELALALGLITVSCGGTGGGPPPLLPPSGDVPSVAGAGSHPALGLVTAAAGETSIRVGWRAVDLPTDAPAAALFVGTDPDTLLDEAPRPIDPVDLQATVSGLAEDTTYFTRLAFDDGAGGWDAAGPRLMTRTGTPVLVLSGADATIADGLTPATAWPSIEEGIAAASLGGGGNVWVSGDFQTAEITVPASVDLYGGFDATFELDARDPAGMPATIQGTSTSSVITLARADQSVAVLDGFRIDGSASSDACFEVDQRFCELRSLAGGRAGRGFKLRSADNNNPVEVTMVRCAASVCIAGGTSISGAFDLYMEDCAMSGNGQEGLTADNLTGNVGEVSRVFARDCVFSGNGSEGFDVDLATSGDAGSGRWVIRLEDCIFSDNALDGCLIDCDYEGEPGWFARFEIEGCEARRNGEAGFHLDVDAQANSHVHRTVAAANRAEGILISSETAPGTVVIDTSALVGNQTYGVRTEMGNVGLLLSHCVVAGNRLGAQFGGVAPILATSSIAYLQPGPWSASDSHRSVDTVQTQPLPFAEAPSALYPVLSFADGVATLAVQPTLGIGATVELNDSGQVLLVESVTGTEVGLADAPTESLAPGVLGWFESGSVVEDWRLSGGSPALGAGMALPGGPARDAGIFGASVTGAPGRLDLQPVDTFWFAETAPTWSRAIGSSESLVLRFEGGTLDTSTGMAGVDAVDAAGSPVPIGILTAGSVVIVSPPGTGWTTGTRIQVHDSLRTLDGRELCASVAIPLTVAP